MEILDTVRADLEAIGFTINTTVGLGLMALGGVIGGRLERTGRLKEVEWFLMDADTRDLTAPSFDELSLHEQAEYMLANAALFSLGAAYMEGNPNADDEETGRSVMDAVRIMAATVARVMNDAGMKVAM